MRRIKPERGWAYGKDVDQFEFVDVTVQAEPLQLLSFDEIDNDDGGIIGDKSDWFCRRVILDVLCNTITPDSQLTRRWCQCMLVVADDTVINQVTWDDNPWNEALEDYVQRIIYSWSQDCSVTRGIPHTGTAIATDATAATSFALDSGNAPIFHVDVKTTFSLRPGTSVYLIYGADNNNVDPFGVPNADFLTISVAHRFLLQKRIG